MSEAMHGQIEVSDGLEAALVRINIIEVILFVWLLCNIYVGWGK